MPVPLFLHAALRSDLRLDGRQFRARLIANVFESSGMAIPITAVARVALHLVQHGMYPRRRGLAFVLLHEVVRGIPLAGQGQFDGAKQFIEGRVHGWMITFGATRRQAAFGAGLG